MGFFSGMALGNALTKLTNVFEEMEHTRHTMPIGAGGGINSLPKARQQEIERKMPNWLATLKKQPRHVVTQELLKNMKVSQQLRRAEREVAQAKLLEWLINEDVALDLETFAKSYLG